MGRESARAQPVHERLLAGAWSKGDRVSGQQQACAERAGASSSRWPACVLGKVDVDGGCARARGEGAADGARGNSTVTLQLNTTLRTPAAAVARLLYVSRLHLAGRAPFVCLSKGSSAGRNLAKPCACSITLSNGARAHPPLLSLPSTHESPAHHRRRRGQAHREGATLACSLVLNHSLHASPAAFASRLAHLQSTYHYHQHGRRLRVASLRRRTLTFVIDLRPNNTICASRLRPPQQRFPSVYIHTR